MPTVSIKHPHALTTRETPCITMLASRRTQTDLDSTYGVVFVHTDELARRASQW